MNPETARTVTIHNSANPCWEWQHWFKRSRPEVGARESIQLDVWSWDSAEGHTHIGYAKVPWPGFPGLFQYQLELQSRTATQHTSEDLTSVITCCLQFLPEGSPPETSAKVVKTSKLPLAWTGVLSVTLDKALVVNSVFGRHAADLLDADACIDVPTCHLYTASGSSLHAETWNASTLKHVELRKPLVWTEKHSYKVNLLHGGGAPPPGLNIHIRMAVTRLRQQSKLVGHAYLSLQKAFESTSHLLDIEGDSGQLFEGTISLTTSWQPPFMDPFLGSYSSNMFQNLARQGDTPEDLKQNMDYHTAYNLWQEFAKRDEDNELKATSKQFAGNLMHNFWSPSSIAHKLVMREHIVPKLFKRVPPLTRCERYSCLSSAMQAAFFFQTLFFRADCQMIPRPAACKPTPTLIEKFIPSWVTFWTAIFALIMSLPAPLTLISLFRKMPVEEKMNEKEKKLQLMQWYVRQTIGWMLFASFHAFVAIWLIKFSSEFGWPVFERWLNTGGQSLIHRFLTAPVARALFFAAVVVTSKFVGCCDWVLVLCPNMLLMGAPRSLQAPPKAAKPGDRDAEDHADHDHFHIDVHGD